MSSATPTANALTMTKCSMKMTNEVVGGSRKKSKATAYKVGVKLYDL